MKLKMIEFPPIFKKEQINEATMEKRLIRDSWIYEHFKNDSTKKTKIALYVNQSIPINQNLYLMHNIEEIGNHCAVALGLEYKNGKECLELEIHDECDDL